MELKSYQKKVIADLTRYLELLPTIYIGAVLNHSRS